MGHKSRLVASAVVAGAIVGTLLSDPRPRSSPSTKRPKKSKKEAPPEDKSTAWSEWEYQASVDNWLSWRLNSAGKMEHEWYLSDGEASTKNPTAQEPVPAQEKPTSQTNPISKNPPEDEVAPAAVPPATSLPIEQANDNRNTPHIVVSLIFHFWAVEFVTCGFANHGISRITTTTILITITRTGTLKTSIITTACIQPADTSLGTIRTPLTTRAPLVHLGFRNHDFPFPPRSCCTLLSTISFLIQNYWIKF